MPHNLELDYSQICTVKGCDRHQTTKVGFCQSHYQMYRTLIAKGLTDEEARTQLDETTRRYKTNTKRTCCVEGCNKPYYAKGMCRVHYARLVRNSAKID